MEETDLDMADKAVSTDDDVQVHDNSSHWKMVQLESLLAALVDSKVVAMKAAKSRSKEGYHRTVESPNKLTSSSQSSNGHKHHRHHYHHHHHHHHHHRHKQNIGKNKAVCKVRQWDDGSAVVLTERTSDVAETDFCNGDVEVVHGCRAHTKLRLGDERYVTLEMESLGPCDRPRRKRRKKRPPGYPGTLVQKTKVIDPEDLPKRARWTIIITAGFLLLTCMLLVGITLRMAPIIDQMVRNENEQLMNSLNRHTFNGSLTA